jgi:arginine decarboxylase
MEKMVPKRIFFTKGVGVHRNQLQSMELALRGAQVERCNLVTVSSIFPPHCRITSLEEGVKYLHPGEITFVVMAKEQTNEPNRLIAAAVGLAQPKESAQYGYLSEHHGYGQTKKKAEDFAEDLAAQMLATTMGIEIDPNIAWDERKQVYKVNKQCNFISRSIAQTAEGNKDGLWTTVVAMAVLLME